MMRQRKASGGYVTIQMLGMILLALMFSSLAVDFGVYYAAQNVIQSAADSGSLAATKELFTGNGSSASDRQSAAKVQASNLVNTYTHSENPISIDPNTDVTFGYINPQSKVYNPSSFTTPSTSPNYAQTGGYNAVRITVKKASGTLAGPLPSVMAAMIGVNTMNTQAVSVAMFDGNIAQVTDGLRPLYGCLAQFNLANADGNIANNRARLFGTNLSLDGATVPGCPPAPSGNWGFADLRNGTPNAPGNNDIAEWFLEGFNHDGSENNVGAGGYYSTQPGAAVTSHAVQNALDTLIANQTVFMIPLIDSVTGSGSNTKAHIVGFSGFKITGYRANGPSASRYIEGQFVKTICNETCLAGGTLFGGGAVKLRLSR